MQMQSQVSARFQEPQYQALRAEEAANMTTTDASSLSKISILVNDECAPDPLLIRRTALKTASQTLLHANIGLYNSDGQLVRLTRLPKEINVNSPDDEHAGPYGLLRAPLEAIHLVSMDASSLNSLLWQYAILEERKKGAKGPRTKQVSRVPEFLNALMTDDWRPYPKLEGIATCPQINLKTGKTRLEEGYDQKTHIYYDFSGCTFDDAPANPTIEDVHTAKEFLLDLISEFQFSPLPDGLPDPSDPQYNEAVERSREVSRSVVFSMLLTSSMFLLAKHPLFFGASSNPGSGKSTIADILAIIITSLQSAITYSWPKSSEEQDKQLMTISLQKHPFVSFDNVEGTINAERLCIMITQGVLSGRLFGKINESVHAKVNTFFYMNGNNSKPTKDLVRRTLQFCLNAFAERSTDVVYKREIMEYTARNRKKIWKYILTIMRYTIQNIEELEQKYQLRQFNGFEQWSNIVRRACLLCGLEDPLLSQDSLYAGDPDRQALANVIGAWREIYGENTQISVAEIFKSTGQTKSGDPNIKTRAEEFLEVLEAVVPGRDFSANTVGLWLRDHTRQPCNGWMIEAGKKTKVGRMWMLTRVQAPSASADMTPATEAMTAPSASADMAPATEAMTAPSASADMAPATEAMTAPSASADMAPATAPVSWMTWDSQRDAYYG